jgi:predicted XRE-type DNA-binding protein
MNITKGSGNVFEDLGFPPEEAKQLKTKTDLIISLRKIIKSRQWTKAQAARYFGEPESVINDLLDVEIDRFTVEQLVRLVEMSPR